MKLIFENFRNAINEGYIPAAPGVVKNVKFVTPPMFAVNELFIVAEFIIHSGERMKFGFYTTSSTNHPDQTYEGEWVPCLGIGAHSGGGVIEGLPWFIKIKGKIVRSKSVLAAVSRQLGNMFPRDKQIEIKDKAKEELTIKSREGRGKPGGRTAAREALDQKNIDAVNAAFKRHGVYNPTSLVPMTPDGKFKIS
jgi:hypothetical protein|tara:strand:+ start:80 stop:661 length:582 start_codon:yes stop_codon:yes gene_type:complete